MAFATPDDAEQAFYAAFNRGDPGAMRTIWLDEDCIVCVHPHGQLLNGREAVFASWDQILVSAGDLQHETRSRSQGPRLAVHTGVEWIASGPMLTVTNVFQLGADGWRMLLHHAAPVHRAQPRSGPLH